MEFSVENCATQMMKKEKRETTKGIGLQNQENLERRKSGNY